MKLDVINKEGKKVKTIELPSKIFEAPISVDLMHQAFTRQMANARLGTHETKVRGDVAGGGKKPWRQKGTGRARQGSIRSAQWVGGGKIHTPHARKYTKSMPKKMRRAALRSALSVKAAESMLVLVDDLSMEQPKTSEFAKMMFDIVGESTALILINGNSLENEALVRSANNLPYVKTLMANYLNIRDLFKYDKVVLPLAALETIEAYLG